MKIPITIIGGGLAGLGLANGLRMAGLPVEVFEAGRYPRHRVCGEFMAGLDYKTISQLGIKDCFADALLHRNTAWIRNGRTVAEFRLPEPAIGISRYALDVRMAELLRKRGGILHEEKTVIPKKETEGTLYACGRPPGKAGWFGMKGHWSDVETSADLELHLGKGAYLGLSRVEEGYVNVCGLFKQVAVGEFPSPLERFHATLKNHRLGYLIDRLPANSLRPGSLRSVSGLAYGFRSATKTLSIGDHRQLIPPFTGNGMTLALESAETILPHAIRFGQGRSTWADFKRDSQAALLHRFKIRNASATLLHPFILNPTLQLFLSLTTRLNLLPFRRLYHLTHA
ncbi:MAG TPA: hypothetical protein VK995_00840 [Oceanipulchritudo sp.]|nr:hypothetical protein [Oceanipulchritudo sp.]